MKYCPDNLGRTNFLLQKQKKPKGQMILNY